MIDKWQQPNLYLFSISLAFLICCLWDKHKSLWFQNCFVCANKDVLQHEKSPRWSGLFYFFQTCLKWQRTIKNKTIFLSETLFTVRVSIAPFSERNPTSHGRSGYKCKDSCNATTTTAMRHAFTCKKQAFLANDHDQFSNTLL